MEIIAVSGKGGVGKSTVASAISVYHAMSGKPTLLVDCDKQGLAIRRTVFPEGITIPKNKIYETPLKNLYAGAIAPCRFWPIAAGERRSKPEFAEYMNQFPGAQGLVAYNDMLRQFFGAFTLPEQASELINLAELLNEATSNHLEKIVLDLEPTKGTIGLLNSVGAVARSITNLSMLGPVIKSVLGMKMPDIRKFLDSEYMGNSGEYTRRLSQAERLLQGARYILVTGPQGAMVDEALLDTQTAIQDLGGKISGYVVNNVHLHGSLPSNEEESERRQVGRVLEAGEKASIPVGIVGHTPSFGIDDVPNRVRQTALFSTGNNLVSLIGEVDTQEVVAGQTNTWI